MNELKEKITQEEKTQVKSEFSTTENFFIALLRQKKQFLPWLISLVLVGVLILLGVSLNSHRQAQKEMQEQLDRQNLVINGLEARMQETVDTSKSVPVITSETIKSDLGCLQELVTQEYIYTNADRRDQDAKWIFGWTRPFSNSVLVLTYDGTIKAGVDMGEIDVDVDEEARTITITLPDSKITDNTIPQESITVVEVKDGLFNDVTFDDYNSFISEQKIIMEEKAIERGLLAKADEEAKRAIQTFLSSMPGIGSGEGEYKLIIE